MAISYKNSIFKSTNVRIYRKMQTVILEILFSIFWKIFPAMVKRLVLRLFFRPGPCRLTDTQKKLRAEASVFHFKSKEDTLTGYRWGNGPAVVFVHGWAGNSLQFHKYIEPLISAGYSVICFDQACHGVSKGRTASYFQFSDAVYQLLESEVDDEIAAVIGHSLGASAVINYFWRTGKQIPVILIAPALDLVRTIEDTLNRYGVPSSVFNSIIRDFEERMGHHFMQENPADLLRSLTQEIVVVHDTNDIAVPYEASWNAGLIQTNIRLLSTSGLGHIRILEDESVVQYIHQRVTGGSDGSGRLLIADYNPGNNDRTTGHLE